MSAWWGSKNNVSARLRLEVEAMRATFDNTFKLIVPLQGALYWEGDVELNLATLESPFHRLKILRPAKTWMSGEGHTHIVPNRARSSKDVPVRVER